MAYNTTITRDSNDLFNLSEFAESELFKYKTPKKYKWPVERDPKRLIPQQNEYRAKGNNVITFDIPNDHIYDFSESMIHFDVRIVSTGGTYRRIHNGTWNLFSRVRHLANNRKIEEKVDYGDIYSVEWVFQGDEDMESTMGVDLLGIETQATRNIWGASAGKRLATPLNVGFLTAGLFPAKFLTERHQLELYIQDPLLCLETDGTAPDIFISNIRWHCHILKDSLNSRNRFGQSVDHDGFEANIKGYVESGNFMVHYNSWETFQNPIFSVNHDLVISHRAAALSEILTIYRNENDRSNTLVNDKLMTFPKLDTTSYQFRINGAYFPDIAVDCTGDALDAYHHYLHWVNAWKLGGFDTDMPDNPNVTLDGFNTTEFIIAADFKPSCEKKFIATLPTIHHNQDPQLNIKFSVPPPAGMVAIHLMKFTTIAKIAIEGGATRIVICE